jgi:hypothetical protein
MDLQGLFNALLGVLATVGAFLFKTLWSANEKIREDFSSLEKNLPVIYVRKDDFALHAHRVEDSLRRIEDKLDKKMDKA